MAPDPSPDGLEIVVVPDESGDGRPPLVFLHEGLGSVELWRSFPADLRAAVGRPAMLVYSRAGYGRSPPIERPWPVSYMHREALEVLPALLAAHGVTRPVLVGHSDGASIALIHAGHGHPVAGLVLLAPHVFVEDVTVAAIAAAGEAYGTTGLRARLAAYHDDVDGVFWGWNEVWRSSGFRRWDIRELLPGIAVPVLALQGEDDEYGSLAQLDAIERGVRGPFERHVVPAAGHVLHTGDTDRLVRTVARFYGALRSLGNLGDLGNRP
jgi:pimeloyl-ACP methyl ester carboxylesterase